MSFNFIDFLLGFMSGIIVFEYLIYRNAVRYWNAIMDRIK